MALTLPAEPGAEDAAVLTERLRWRERKILAEEGVAEVTFRGLAVWLPQPGVRALL